MKHGVVYTAYSKYVSRPTYLITEEK